MQHHPGLDPGAGGCHGALVQERVPSVWHSALGTIPTLSDWQHLPDPSCCILAPSRPFLWGIVATWLQEQRDWHPLKSPGGLPGAGVECLCFICLIKTKASRAAQGAQPSGAGTLHKVIPWGSPVAERDHGTAGSRAFPAAGPPWRTLPHRGPSSGPPPGVAPGRPRGKTSPVRRLFSRGGSLRSGRASSLGAKGSLGACFPPVKTWPLPPSPPPPPPRGPGLQEAGAGSVGSARKDVSARESATVSAPRLPPSPGAGAALSPEAPSHPQTGLPASLPPSDVGDCQVTASGGGWGRAPLAAGSRRDAPVWHSGMLGGAGAACCWFPLPKPPPCGEGERGGEKMGCGASREGGMLRHR
ncbi:collagen alpha-2(I) chain-like [Manacus candei]|uniref:collagen alpha-2(I) chain-like n=1 Tax=Manacus candei TaxID=415023 RepID=UPI002226A923|nr:collagen alpha-2(I) chain-like [Manacus candei]